jgi:hypothetical protein
LKSIFYPCDSGFATKTKFLCLVHTWSRSIPGPFCRLPRSVINTIVNWDDSVVEDKQVVAEQSQSIAVDLGVLGFRSRVNVDRNQRRRKPPRWQN